jgi:hypothetical protein
VDHAAQLLHAFHRASVEIKNDVVFFHSRFAGGGVLINQRYFDAVFFLELQITEAISGDIAGVHAEVRSAAEVFARISERLTEGFLRTELGSVGACKEHRDYQHSKDRFAHISHPIFGGLAAGADEIDISGCGTNLQNRPSAVQITFSSGAAWSPFATFTDNSNFGKI